MNKISVAGLVLAAGMSTRYNGIKLLSIFNGAPMIVQTVKNALSSRLDKVVVVLGHEAEKIESALKMYPDVSGVEMVTAAGYEKGMAESLKAGVESVRRDFDAAMILLGDMPLIKPGMIDELIRFHETEGSVISAPACRGRRGHPVLFDAAVYPELMKLDGDQGARKVLNKKPDRVNRMRTNDLSIFNDIDTPSDLKKLMEKNDALIE